MKIGVIADNTLAPYKVYDLISWIDEQKDIEANVLIIQNAPKGSKLKELNIEALMKILQ